MFHHFWGDGRHPDGQGAVTAEQFDDMIRWLGRDRILDAAEWQRRAMVGRLEDGDLCLSFDDSLSCQFDIAKPVLDAHQVTAFWFVNSDPLKGKPLMFEVYRFFRSTRFDSFKDYYKAFLQSALDGPWCEPVRGALATFNPKDYLKGFDFYSDEDRAYRFLRDQVLGPVQYELVLGALMASRKFNPATVVDQLWMSPEQVKALAAEGHVIGLHSRSHPMVMADLSPEEQAEQYAENQGHLSSLIGRRPDAMSHPCNSYNAATLKILDGLGVRLGFRANMESGTAYGRLEFPRRDHAVVLKEMSA